MDLYEKEMYVQMFVRKLVRKSCDVTWMCGLFLSDDIPVSSRFFILQVPQAV